MVEADNSIGVRISGPPKDFVKGSINNRPFRPGGLDDSQSAGRTFPDGASNGEWVQELLVGGPAQVVPPTFKQGMKLGDLKVLYFIILKAVYLLLTSQSVSLMYRTF